MIVQLLFHNGLNTDAENKGLSVLCPMRREWNVTFFAQSRSWEARQFHFESVSSRKVCIWLRREFVLTTSW